MPAERRRLLVARTLKKNWFLLAGWFILLVTLLMTQSRAGVFATIVALLVLIIALGSRRPRPLGSILISIAIILVAIVGIFPLSGAGLDVRLQQIELSWPGRLDIYDRALLAIQDAPVTGMGLGTFESVFRFYGTDATDWVVEKAHSDYLELVLELGFPATIAFITALVVVGLMCAAGVFRRSRDFMFPCIGLGVSVLIGMHSLVDFSLQIPAVALIFSITLGVATSQSSSSQD